jgi:DNA-binding transcriptional ArsR family regulator
MRRFTTDAASVVAGLTWLTMREGALYSDRERMSCRLTARFIAWNDPRQRHMPPDQPKLFKLGAFGRLESDDPGFYQDKGLAAGSDPNSRAAFDKLEKSKNDSDRLPSKLTGMRLAIYEALSAWGEMSPHELARRLDIDIVTVRARITELFNDRYIKRLDFKRKTPSGNTAYVYVVKEKKG